MLDEFHVRPNAGLIKTNNCSPLRNNTKLELRKVGRRLEVVRNAERVVELIRVHELEGERRVRRTACPRDVDI